jgi:signal transduction histidine kinase
MPTDELPSVGSFDELIASRMLAESTTLAGRWLERLTALLPVGAEDVFPGHRLLDHIPALVGEIAQYLGVPDAQEIGANTAVIEKARQLGLLRHEQRASLHQLLREYELLAEILEAFLSEEVGRIAQPPPLDLLRVSRRIDRAVRSLMRLTVETFIAAYTETLADQQRKLESFRHMVSHEFRNPLGTLMFAARVLGSREAAEDPTRSAKAIDVIQRNVERLGILIDNLQHLSGDVLAGDRPTEQVVELTAFAKEVSRQLREMAEARGVDIVIADDLPVTVVDPARLELILMNLVSNAIKYADTSKNPRRVEIARADAPAGSWGIVVSDNGLGIPATALPEIFNRFTRAHSTLDAELGIDGSGLGLAIVKESVQALGGTITCRSTVAVGTSFELRVPLTKV